MEKQYTLNASHAVLLLGWIAGGLLFILGYKDIHVGITMPVQLRGYLLIFISIIFIIGVVQKNVRTSKWMRGGALIVIGVLMSIPSISFIKDSFDSESTMNKSSKAQGEDMINNAVDYVVVKKVGSVVVSQKQATKEDIKVYIACDKIKANAATLLITLPVFILAIIFFINGYKIIKSTN